MQQRESAAPDADMAGPGAVPVLESHLRNLILNNASTTDTDAAPASPNSSSHYPTTQHAGGPGNMTHSEQSGPQSPNQGRRRLNQAQRRQMSSQLSIQVDPRAQEQPFQPRHDYGHQGQQPLYPPPGRGHHQPRAHSHAAAGRSHGAPPPNSWNGPPQHYAAEPPVHHRGTPNRRFGSRSVFPTDGMSPSYDRRASGPLHNPHRASRSELETIASQASLLNDVCFRVVNSSEIDRSEIAEKENFRQRIESISGEIIASHEEQQAAHSEQFPQQSVQLKCFGSLSSGFATKASDMDLGILSPLSTIQPDEPGSPIPRLLEKALLDAGFGARLLTRTRVPIIKLCEKPSEKLLQGLLAERHTWEQGLEHDSHDESGDEEHGHDVAIQASEVETQKASKEAHGASSKSTSNVQKPANGDGHQFNIYQGEKLSLEAYYNWARRRLQKTGGHDITVHNRRDFSDREHTILNQFCQAFVDGLFDSELRQRLSQYPSLSFKNSHDMPTNRSLYGVYLQMIGEEILLQWEASNEKILLQAPDSQAAGSLRSWANAQCRTDFGLDPIGYNKELQTALHRIQQAPIVRLLTLKQAQNETPSQYHLRTKQISTGLGPNRVEVGPPNAAQDAAVVERYVSGIFHQELRDPIKAFMNESSEPASLDIVARRHKCLHLAFELEHAVEKDMYEGSQVEAIKAYVDLLRSPLQEVSGSHEYIIPIPLHMTETFAMVKTMQDPHSLAPNQPRDRYGDKLEFPKDGAGVQCDINFSAHLALHNTLLLRCYSHTDPRVRPMVLFIKHWAKVRGINSGYRGTLSSYGYVLMVLHYLVNVAQPFVCPNLQQLARPPPPNLSPAEAESTILCKGYNVQFWRNEQEISDYARANQLNHNAESIGHLLWGFFEYYAQSGPLRNGFGKGFDWGRDVLSLRTPGGLVSKQMKGWTGAKTVVEDPKGAAGPPPPPQADAPRPQPQATTAPSSAKKGKHAGKAEGVKEVRYRYLFAVEDPFELDHNVARTVTHNGIVSIRDEFRRAWRIIRASGRSNSIEELLHDVNEANESQAQFLRLLDDIHGLREGRQGGVAQ